MLTIAKGIFLDLRTCDVNIGRYYQFLQACILEAMGIESIATLYLFTYVVQADAVEERGILDDV